jgi:CheY-like chemotaxis protein
VDNQTFGATGGSLTCWSIGLTKKPILMSFRILIVEDEIFVAAEIEQVVSDMGHEPVGIAPDKRTALQLASDADVALVDLNLRDGPTGIEIGRILAQTHGVSVVYLTANPSQLKTGIPGTIGVVSKPISQRDLNDVVSYAIARRRSANAQPPQRLHLFGNSVGAPAF